MESSILIYFLKASISIAFFYGLYMLLLKNDTFLSLKRIYFLFAMLFSLLFPFISIEVSSQDAQQIPTYLLFAIDVTPSGKTEMNADVATDNGLPIFLFMIASCISMLLLCKFIFQLYSLFQLKNKNEIEYEVNYSIVKISDNSSSSFSFFRWIFINVNNENQKDINEIITHEKVHARQIHSVDVLLAESLCIVLWWNPFVWLLKREMKINLEYLADRGVLNEGYDTRSYQYALLQVGSNNAGIPLINNFNVSQLKKRITMMNKKKTSILVAAKYLLALPIVVGLLMVNCSQKTPSNDEGLAMAEVPVAEEGIVMTEIPTTDAENAGGKESGVEPFRVVEQMPSYPGGEAALHEFINTNLKYPVAAQEAGIQGRVTVRFTVTATGAITDIEIMRGIDPACDAEAKRVIEAMPNWNPGKQAGVAVPVYFTLPMVFRLNQ